MPDADKCTQSTSSDVDKEVQVDVLGIPGIRKTSRE